MRTRDTQMSNKNLAKILKKIPKQIPKMVQVKRVRVLLAVQVITFFLIILASIQMLPLFLVTSLNNPQYYPALLGTHTKFSNELAKKSRVGLGVGQ